MFRSITFLGLLVALIGCAANGSVRAQSGLDQLAAKEDRK